MANHALPGMTGAETDPQKQWSIVAGPLTKAQRREVLELNQQSLRHDGVAALSETPLLHLSSGKATLTHLRAVSNQGRLLGYCQVDRSGSFASAELVVTPSFRRLGIGRALAELAAMDARIPTLAGQGAVAGKPLRFWAHHNLAPAQGFAAKLGLQPVRHLLQMSRSLTTEATGRNPWVSTWRNSTNAAATGYRNRADAAPPQAGYVLRTFQVGHDDEAWLTANAAAFVAHPEQGRLTEVDLQERLAQAWFDARGFFLVCAPDGSVAAFCWTKVPLSAEATAGEIYAIGVTPENQRRGLAGFLLEIAFAHLTAFGLTEVTLFVEESNLAARAVYSEVGFQEVTRDVQYEKAS